MKSLLKTLSIFAILSSSIGVLASGHNDPKSWKFDQQQIKVLKQAQQKCNQKNVNGKMCAAIVWHESSAGKNKENKHSVGNFHNLVKTVSNREKIWKKTKSDKYSGISSRIEVKNKLLSSIDYEIKHSTAQIKECTDYLKKLNKLTNKNVLACYNGGYGAYKSKQAQTYASNVLLKMKYLDSKLEK